MNSKQAKEIQLSHIMSLLGYEVKKVERAGKEYKYISPFRGETEPSFNVNLVKNLWFDFGLSKGGNSLDFALTYITHYGKGSTVADALQWLEELVKHQSIGRLKKRPKVAPVKKENSLKFISADKVRSEKVKSYLHEERKIALDLIDHYLLEIKYKNLNTKKVHCAFGMKNLSNGYEIRSASSKYKFKSSLIKKDITLVPGFTEKTTVVNLFEGMLDFLSLLTMMKTDSLFGDNIIMHSLSSYRRTTEIIKERSYQSINSFFDNNNSGKQHTKKLYEDFGRIVSDQSNMFLPHEDINDMLKVLSI